MFAMSRNPSVDDLKFYDMYLPDGTVLENMMFRYVGRNGEEEWLQDYVGYNLNMVTFDMRVLSQAGDGETAVTD